MKKIEQLQIIFAYNVRSARKNKTEPQIMAELEFDEPHVIGGIREALESLGHTIYPVEANEFAYEKLRKLKGRVDLAFNFAEGMGGVDREAHMPAVFEMLDIPYTGGSPLTYALGLNKEKCKEILAYHKIPTPRWQLFERVNEPLDSKLVFPLIAKPKSEGSSKGIGSDCLVHEEAAMRRIVRRIRRSHHHDALVEEYLPGREFTVAVIGTPLRVLPIVEVRFDELPEEMPKFDHFEAKWILDSPESDVDPLVCPAEISKSLAEKSRPPHCTRAACWGSRTGRASIFAWTGAGYRISWRSIALPASGRIQGRTRGSRARRAPPICRFRRCCRRSSDRVTSAITGNTARAAIALGVV